MTPDQHPYGQTKYKNYDPANVNSAEDAADVFEWLAGENREAGNPEAAAVYRECADLIRSEVVNHG